MANGSSVTVEITGGPTINVPWSEGMNAQQALEGAYNNQSAGTFNYALQYYGATVGYFVIMINETYDSFISSGGAMASPFYYWEFFVNGTPSAFGIDSTILNAGDVVGFSLEIYVPEKHGKSSLRVKHEAQTKAANSR
jgi:hypothetical protein